MAAAGSFSLAADGGDGAADIPPIPVRSHHRHRDDRSNPHAHSTAHSHSHSNSNSNSHSRRHSGSSRSKHGASDAPKPSTRSRSQRPAPSLALPASDPEVISNLITSLGALPRSASAVSSRHRAPFDPPAVPPSLSLPASPGTGSFGVDYGAFAQSRLDDVQFGPVSLDDLAASPPVVRTAKPPSGFTPLTASSSLASPPKARSSSRDSALRSFIRTSTSSRPSSTGSFGSKHDDAQSIGNLSIERGSAPTPELRHQRSRDSWGKRSSSRAGKGLMYMSSKERLREKDLERKRTSGGASASTNPAGADSSASNTARPDPPLAETPIREEPAFQFDTLAVERPMDTPHFIPPRDSSLRKSTSSSVRSSTRRSKQRENEAQPVDPIPEAEEPARSRDGRHKKSALVPSELPQLGQSFLFNDDECEPRTRRPIDCANLYSGGVSLVEENDDGAPFPSVSQGRRREEAERNKRYSGRSSPGPNEGIRLKRSSSRLKRLSGPLSPRNDERTSPAPAEPSHNATSTGYERPLSADSVDDAVESYLCSPRLSQKIRHPQTGRVISFSEVGDADGSAVFCCVGMGLTRYITAFYDELALTLKLRLITPDRPGVGDSEPYTDGTATPLSWPDDVYAICQALKITKFSVLAHSAGAIYALATALRMPQHIRGRIHLLAPWIPPSQMNVFGASQASPPTHAIPTSQRILRALPTPFLKAANSSFMTATSSSITSSLPKNPRRGKRKSNTTGRDSATTNRASPVAQDQENLAPHGKDHQPPTDMEPPSATENMDRMVSPRSTMNGDSTIAAAANSVLDKERQMTYDMRLTHAIWELATTGANPAVDLLVCLERRHTIGFRYVDITRPVTIHHGSRDTRVPVDNVKWLGKTMRRCEVRVLDGEGHGLMASASVMGSVLMEMSKEWEDWNRATDADGRKERERERERGRRAAGR
ncbi:hypothetical protein S40293_04794 [Stachybotrys chartarum IBT 40293]|nr:hypothetical protein S40293_04794 [Stachybotrys chartarum IBT 40293]